MFKECVICAKTFEGKRKCCSSPCSNKLKARNKRKDITGLKFNRLTAKSFAYTKHGACWLFVCDCGKEKIANSSEVRTGKTKSCGCWNLEKKIERIKAWSKLPYEQKGFIEKYHQGESASYSATHHWLNRTHPQPEKCQKCGRKGEFSMNHGKGGLRWNIEYAQIHGMKMKKALKNFFTLCKTCHNTYDQKGRKKSAAFCEAMSKRHKGKKVSEETRQKLREAMKKQDWSFHRSDEYREKMRKKMIGNKYVLGKRWKVKKKQLV